MARFSPLEAGVLFGAGVIAGALALAAFWPGGWARDVVESPAPGAAAVAQAPPPPVTPTAASPAWVPAQEPARAEPSPVPAAAFPVATVPPTQPVLADEGVAGETATAAPVLSRPLSLLIPVEGVTAAQLSDTFADARGEGRLHDAIDIMAPTGTPVRAVEDGRVAKLFDSDAGGLTVYQFDAGEEVAYYYAHLDRYAEGLAEGQELQRGDLVGYVGYTGNANPAGPHLHFAIFVLGPEKQWWRGTAINPYPHLAGR